MDNLELIVLWKYLFSTGFPIQSPGQENRAVASQQGRGFTCRAALRDPRKVHQSFPASAFTQLKTKEKVCS